MSGSSDPQIVFDGDSLTAGAGSSGGCTYPNLTIQALGAPWGGYNLGVPGAGIGSLVSGAAANVDTKYNASHSKNIVILWAGSNDLANSSGQTATVYSAIQTFGNARKAVGWTVVIVSILPRTATNGSFETDRQSLATSLLGDFTGSTSDPNIWTGAGYADYLLNITADSTIGSSGENITGPYDSDHIHLNNGGYEYFAKKIVTLIQMIP